MSWLNELYPAFPRDDQLTKCNLLLNDMLTRYKGTSKDFKFTFSLKWFPTEDAYFNAYIWKVKWKFL